MDAIRSTETSVDCQQTARCHIFVAMAFPYICFVSDSCVTTHLRLMPGYELWRQLHSTAQYVFKTCYLIKYRDFTSSIFIRSYAGQSRRSSVGMAAGYGLDDSGTRVRVLVCQEFSLFHIILIRPGVHPASYPTVTGRSVSGVKLTTHLRLAPRSTVHGSIHPLPHTPSWRRA
jgi:hypothetical protein